MPDSSIQQDKELREKLRHVLKRYKRYLNGPVPSDLLYGHPDVVPEDVLVDEAMRYFEEYSDEYGGSLMLQGRISENERWLSMYRHHVAELEERSKSLGVGSPVLDQERRVIRELRKRVEELSS